MKTNDEDILKPAYNIVDMLEVELLDDDSEPRAFSEQLKQVKRNRCFTAFDFQ